MNAAATKPQVQQQGTIVAEWDAGDELWMVMYPNGSVELCKDKRTVERKAKSWFYIHNDHTKIGLGMIEWRKK